MFELSFQTFRVNIFESRQSNFGSQQFISSELGNILVEFLVDFWVSRKFLQCLNWQQCAIVISSRILCCFANYDSLLTLSC